ncbi:MAG: CCA tRNA nucleotidyltransferase, partial [Chitinophagia bacterium]|nr:CCA tRNA nucleotidyltransferase [Chitinophagia bacterium]
MTKFDASLIDRGALEVCQVLKSNGYKAYLVGGCVRDLMMGRSPKDWDIASDAKPEETIKLFEQNNYKVVPTGIDHGTVTIFLDKEGYEITTFRGEGEYTDGRRPDSVFFVDSIEQDLSRRDLTMNAMALDPIDLKLIDPFGGMQDIKDKKIRTVGSADERFSEDGLRTMRAARFASTFGFTLDEEVKEAIKRNLPILSKVSKERMRDELLKTLKSRDITGLNVLKDTNAFEVISPCFAKINLDEAIAPLNNCNGGVLEKMAILLLQLGFTEATNCLKELRFSNAEVREITSWIKCINNYISTFAQNPDAANARKFLGFIKSNIDGELSVNIFKFIEIAKCLDLPNVDSLSEFKDQKSFSLKDLNIDGKLIQQTFSLKGGPIMKKILDYLLDEVSQDPEKNTTDNLLQLSKEFLDNLPLEDKASIFAKKAYVESLLMKSAAFEKMSSKWNLPEEERKKYLDTKYRIGDIDVLVGENPELFFEGVPAGPEEHHPEIYQPTHNDLVVGRAKELMGTNPAGQYAALVHDLGKGVTDPNIWPKQHSHESLGVPLVEQMSTRLKVPDWWNKLGKFMSHNHLLVHQSLSLPDSTLRKLINKFKSEVEDSRDLFEAFLTACQADAQGRTGKKEVDYPQKEKMLNMWDSINIESEKKKLEIPLAITGNDLVQELGLKPGKQIGLILGKIKDVVKNNQDLNDRDLL